MRTVSNSPNLNPSPISATGAETQVFSLVNRKNSGNSRKGAGRAGLVTSTVSGTAQGNTHGSKQYSGMGNSSQWKNSSTVKGNAGSGKVQSYDDLGMVR